MVKQIGCWKKQWRHNLRYYVGIQLVRLRKITNNSQSGQLVSEPIFELGTCRKQSRRANHSAATFSANHSNCCLHVVGLNQHVLLNDVHVTIEISALGHILILHILRNKVTIHLNCKKQTFTNDSIFFTRNYLLENAFKIKGFALQNEFCSQINIARKLTILTNYCV